MDRSSTPSLAPAAERPVHLVQFYERDDLLADVVADFLAEGLDAGEAAIWIGTDAHRIDVVDRLRLRGVKVESARRDGRLVLLDAWTTLGAFMVDGQPDRARFELHVASVVETSSRLSPRGKVRAFGEMVDLLWRGAKQQAALRLEALWHELQSRLTFELLCAYALDGFGTPQDIRPVCEAHDHVGLPPSASFLHQKTFVYASDIARRLDVERALRASRHDLEDHRALLAECLDSAAIGLHFVGPDGTILWANRTELDLLGYAEHEYVGRNIADFHVDPRTIREMLERLGRNETLRDVPARLRASDGTIKHVAIDANALRRDGEFLYTRCFTRDVTDTVRRARLDRVLADATALLATSLDPYTTLRELVALCVDGLGSACVLRIDSSIARIDYEAAHAARPEWGALLRDWVDARAPATRAELVRLGASDRLYEAGARWSLRVPLRTPDGVIGMITALLGPEDEGDASLHAARVLADRISSFVENARLYREAREAREQAEAAMRAKDHLLALLGHEEQPITSFPGLRALVVDSDGDATETLAALLRARGFSTMVAHSGTQALRVANDFTPDVALLDLHVTDMGGYALAAELRHSTALAGTKLVAVTSHDEAVDRDRAAAAGFDESVAKPVSDDRLAEMLTTLLTPTQSPPRG
jgi:PAS domain S-box-containing protein